MLDIDFIRTNRDAVAQAIADKAISLDLDRLLSIDEQRRSLITKRDSLLAERNQLGIEQAMERGPAIKAELAAVEPKLAAVETEYHALMLRVPQIPAADAPRGDETQNRPIRSEGVPPTFDFDPKDHQTLGTLLKLIDTERGAAVSGFRGYYLTNEAALIHHGLMQLALTTMRQHGFTVMVPPTIVRESALVGSGHFPAGQAEVYQIGNSAQIDAMSDRQPSFLVGTAEPSLLAYFADQVVDASDLPIKVCGISQCYRSEIGSYGKDTKGLYRLHEFMKVEQVVLTEASEAAQQQAFDEMLSISEALLKQLELPYRVVDIATGDMGAGKVRQYDIETWMPSRNAYGETHSNSMLGDWQARRLNIKYRTADGKKSYVYTLNNTVIASPRILIALLENHQQPDGSVRIPAVLQPYVGSAVIRPK